MIRAALGTLLLIFALTGCVSDRPGPKRDKPDPKAEAAEYNVQLGIAYLRQGNLPVAKEKLERAIKDAPRNPDAHSAMALLQERLGNLKDADRYFRSALRLSPKNSEISNNYAVFLCRNNRPEDGVKRFLAAARDPLYSTPEAAYTNAGLCLRSANREAEAEVNFQRALKIRPNYSEAAYQLSAIDFDRGRLQEARARVDGYLGAFRATPDLLLLGVRVTRALGDRLASERYARRLRTDFPESQQTRALSDLNRNPG